MVKKFNEFIKESIMDDILTRNKKGGEKKEDIIRYEDLDNADHQGLAKYIMQNYEPIGNNKIYIDDIGDGDISVVIPINMKGDVVYTESSADDYSKVCGLNIPASMIDLVPVTLYGVEEEDVADENMIRVYPYYDDHMNKDIINLLNIILRKTDDPGIKKK